MKRTFTLLSLLLYAFVTNAIPFLQEGKTWRLLYTNYFYKEKYYHPSHENWFYIENKEIVGDYEYFLIRWETMTFDSNTHGWEQAASNSSNGHDGEDGCIYLHLREENGRVFVLKDDYISFCISKYGAYPDISSMQVDGEDDVLLYDFNLKVGDTYPMPGHVIVQKTGEMSYDGTVYPYQLLSNSLLIVEGIGCVNSFGGLVEYQSKPVVSDYYGMYATYLNWVVVEDNQEEIFQYKNAMSEEQLLKVSDVSNLGHPKDGFIYDLQGHALPQKPAKGIYIQNGRKYKTGGKSIVK